MSAVTLIALTTTIVLLSCANQSLAASCLPAPAGLVGWWPGEGNANDIHGTNNGVFTNPAFAVGEVGQAFSFDGSGNNVRIPASPALDVGAGAGMTIEAWVDSTDSTTSRPIVEWVSPTVGAFAAHFYLHQNGPGTLYANLLDTGGTSHILQTPNGAVKMGQYQHVAVTYDRSSGVGRLFVNGALVTETTLGTITPLTSPDLSIGLRPNTVPFGPIPFVGQIDEVSLYSRALTTNEIADIFQAGSVGKCFEGPPFIAIQPLNQTITVGSNLNFTVGANGAQPLSYQWTMDGTNLAGATDNFLVLTNVQTENSGTYSVMVTNSFGSIQSSNAVLTVVPASPCVTPPAGLVSWWKGDGDAQDSEGPNSGVFTNGAYALGEVGPSFSFDGSGNNVRIPASGSLDVGAGGGMTIEAWIFSTNSSVGRPIVEWVPKKVGAFGAHFWVHAAGPNVLYANLYDTNGVSHIIQTPPGAVPLNTNVHVAVTYDKASGVATLFINGAQAAQSTLGTFTPQTSPDLVIGYRPNTVPFGPIPYIGQIDEVSLYSRALALSEIQAIYSAGASGKCSVPGPPTVFGGPTSQTVTLGQAASFYVLVGGTSPLAYQWLFNSNAIPAATNASLVLTNVQMNQAGVYSVVVTNAYGTALSSNATLNVTFPPASVNVVSESGTSGQMIIVPVALVANGNENTIGFSLSFPTNRLSIAGVSLGTGATGATLQFNTNQPGTVGVAVALSSGSTFAPGTQEVVEISFISAVSAQGYSVPLTFGDLPTKRELSDPAAGLLAANFHNGQVILARSAIEGDVSPRPDGDGAVTIVDWVQVGRYVAALDSPSNASEFQRADCAPRSSTGDGILTVSDWVQAGRYAVGLDPMTAAGGPTEPSGGVVKLAHKKGNDPVRTVTVQGPLIFQGQTGTASIVLNAQGDENALGVSLSFDPKVVSFTTATLGTDATGATMDVNANQATNGQLGIILALPTSSSFSPGTRQILKINFQAITTASVDSAVALTDLPVRREVSDTNAVPVVATYSNGLISVNPKPALAISHSNQNINLSWPTWATNYTLQQAFNNAFPINSWSNSTVVPALTNNAFNVTVPVGNSVQFYRLQHQ